MTSRARNKTLRQRFEEWDAKVLPIALKQNRLNGKQTYRTMVVQKKTKPRLFLPNFWKVECTLALFPHNAPSTDLQSLHQNVTAIDEWLEIFAVAKGALEKRKSRLFGGRLL